MPDLKIYNTSEDDTYTVSSLSTVTQIYQDGRDVLRQRVLKAMMSDTDTDAFYNLSTGVEQLAGTNVQGNDLAGEVLARIRATEERLIEQQLEDEAPESKLDSINILGIETDSIDSVRVMIEIVNQLGDTIDAEVTN
jgi:hypothetical protein